MDLLREIATRKTQFSCIAQKAKENSKEVFTSLAHHLTEEYLISSFGELRRSAASGIDKMDVRQYQKELDKRIADLHHRLRSKQYKAPDLQRLWIDKGNGKQRPLGISTTEDKIVQRAVTDILNLIYEQDFYFFSYGFRPKRDAHQALSYLRNRLKGRRIKWIIDADIQGCFDNFDHNIIRSILTKRVKDKGILRLINQWLTTGIVDGKSLHYNTEGTPQGNIISPLLSNVYMHEALDKWMEETVRPLLKGEMFIIRYADDFIIGFENERDAKRVYRTLPKRMQKYGLTIHPEKSKLIEFAPDEKGNSPTFDFLGFTHHWSKSQRGYFVIKRRTRKKKMQIVVKDFQDTCKKYRHERLTDQHKRLRSKLRGRYQYYGIRGNYLSIYRMYRKALYLWFKWLNRRGQRKSYTWKGFWEMEKRFKLPPPRIVHVNV